MHIYLYIYTMYIYHNIYIRIYIYPQLYSHVCFVEFTIPHLSLAPQPGGGCETEPMIPEKLLGWGISWGLTSDVMGFL